MMTQCMYNLEVMYVVTSGDIVLECSGDCIAVQNQEALLLLFQFGDVLVGFKVVIV